MASRIIDVVDATLRPGDYTPDDLSVRSAMKQYIAANLDDPDLGHETLCSVFFCSRSTVYRLFKCDGGVAAYIRTQRLLHCFDELTAASASTRSVASIATRWGFENPSHFNRLFKSIFRVPPSSVVDRGADSREGAGVPSHDRPRPGFSTWVATL